MIPSMPEKPFRFKQFEVFQSRSAMRVGTDGVLLGAWANVDGAKHILDVGSGTGVIALICAQRSQDALVEAIEIDEGSAEDARYNFSLAPWQCRLKLHQGDFLKIASKEKFDLIISNPPYFSQSLRAADPSRNAARHDDSLPAEQFMAKAKGLLAPEGKIALIFPKNQLSRWTFAAEESGIFPSRICHVFTLPHKDASRVLVEYVKSSSPSEPLMESILIEFSPGQFTEAYKTITKDLYTKW
jgi:tRNA1Val (adenine37-N6)-methyltransferase